MFPSFFDGLEDDNLTDLLAMDAIPCEEEETRPMPPSRVEFKTFEELQSYADHLRAQGWDVTLQQDENGEYTAHLS